MPGGVERTSILSNGLAGLLAGILPLGQGIAVSLAAVIPFPRDEAWLGIKLTCVDRPSYRTADIGNGTANRCTPNTPAPSPDNQSTVTL